MTDCELLEFAAIAACFPYIKPSDGYNGSLGLAIGDNPMRTFSWNPLSNDEDAFRLSVKLEIELHFSTHHRLVYAQTKYILGVNSEGEESYQCNEYFSEPYGSDKNAATRRAIVRSAAALGKSMKVQS